MADVRKLIEALKVPIDNQNNPYTRNGIPDVDLAETGQFVNSFMPISGDIQSGIQAVSDVKNKKYASALLNGLGVLPFVPALGGVIKEAKIADLDLNPAGKAIANSFFMWNPKAVNKVVNKEPVSVVKLPDGQFHLLDGYHRVLQAQKTGKDTININETPMTDDIYNFLLKEGTIKDKK